MDIGNLTSAPEISDSASINCCQSRRSLTLVKERKREMGRGGKLKIERLENANTRKVTYSKRKSGMVKKAKELSTLCDVDLAVLIFPPSQRGKPTLCVGENSDLSLVVEKLLRLTVEERSKRQTETLNLLQRILKREDRDINLQDFSVDGKQKVEELQNQLKQLQLEIYQKNKKLSTYLNPENVNNTTMLRTTEESLVESLRQLKIRKQASLTPVPQASHRHIAPLENPNLGLANGDCGSATSTNGENANLETQLILGFPNANKQPGHSTK